MLRYYLITAISSVKNGESKMMIFVCNAISKKITFYVWYFTNTTQKPPVFGFRYIFRAMGSL